MINLRGEVVGIDTAIFSESGGNIGIGFAIPINLLKELLPQLVSTGKVTRGWLGVSIQAMTMRSLHHHDGRSSDSTDLKEQRPVDVFS